MDNLSQILFMIKKNKGVGNQGKRGHTIGRLIWVPPTTRELYNMRMLLTIKKEPTN